VSASTDLVTDDLNEREDVFRRDRVTSTTLAVSRRGPLPAPATGNFFSGVSAVSANGRYVAFDSAAAHLVTGDANRVGDVFARDPQNGTRKAVSADLSGTHTGDNMSNGTALSADGRFVLFSSLATNLVITDSNGALQDVFVRDLQSGVTTLVSRNLAG